VSVREYWAEEEEDEMLWTNNPEILRVLHAERVRQIQDCRTNRKRGLKLVAMEPEDGAATVR
jgi:hypothetical protein